MTRSGYYRWLRVRLVSEPEHQARLLAVKAIDRRCGHGYGSRRMKKALAVQGIVVSRTQARQLMREAGVQVRHRRKYKATTNSHHARPVFDNHLARRFAVKQINQVYAGDITYTWTGEGWLYLAVVMDLCSRKVVGWSMSSRMTAQLVCDALTMAIWQRRPPTGLIHHSDRGAQYASNVFTQQLKNQGFQGSMSRKGNCWDNAVVESFFGSLKQECVHWRHYPTRYQAQQDILHYITMFYNSQRLHSYLNYRSPNDFEQQLLATQHAA